MARKKNTGLDKELRLGRDFRSGSATRGQVSFLGDRAGQLEGLREGVFSRISNDPDRQNRQVRAGAASSVQQQLGDQATGANSHRSVLSNALRRAKARVGIAQRGDKAVRSQQLKDRLSQVRSGIAAQSRGINAQLTGVNIASGVKAGAERAKAFGQGAVADAFGSSLGGIAATLKGNRDREGSSGFFDFGNNGPGVFRD